MSALNKLLSGVVEVSINEAVQKAVEPILKAEVQREMSERALTAVDAKKEFGITRADLEHLPTVQTSLSAHHRYQVKDIISYLNKNRVNPSKRK